MQLTKDMVDLITLFEKHKVRYAVVGGFAVIAYGYVRLTQDIDFLLYPSVQNAEKIKTALTEFGFGDAGIQWDFFEHEGTAVHLGVEPNRIDLLTHLKGLGNEAIFNQVSYTDVFGIPIPIIAKTDLLVVKKSSERMKDRADAEELEKLDPL